MAIKTTIIENIIVQKVVTIVNTIGCLLFSFKNWLKTSTLIFLFLISLFGFQIASAQALGDYRSKNTNNWKSPAGWQVYNGSNWVDSTTYPGENAGNYTVTILAGHTISITNNDFTTAKMGNLIINGTLALNAINPNINLNASISIDTPLLSVDGGTLNFVNQKTSLFLPKNCVIEFVNNGKISGECSANTRIYIDGNLIASCVGLSNKVIEFEDLVRGGGTLNAIIINPISMACKNQIISFAGSYSGTVSTPVTYKWFITLPDGTTIHISDSQNLPPYTLTNTGIYIISLVVTTIIDNKNYSNIEQITITVYENPTAPSGAINGSRCETGTVTISVSDPGIGFSINWYATASGGNVLSDGAGTSSFTTPSISSTTTYYAATINNTTRCVSVTRTPVIATINTINTWTGFENNDWDNPNNWSCYVPTSTSNLINIITNGVSKYPLIKTDITIKNLEVQNGAIINVLNNGFTITGILTLNGTIDLQNESQLIQTTESTLVSNCTTGKIEIDQQGTSDNFSYNYWSSPVNSSCGSIQNNINTFLKDGSFPSQIKGFLFGSSAYFADVETSPINNSTPNIKLSTYWMHKYANKPDGDYNSWTYIGNTGVLQAGEGFTMKGSNSTFDNQNYTFVGKPNNGLIELIIDNGNQYLIGNPYPSAIDAKEFIKDNIKQYIGDDGNLYSRRSNDVIDGNLYFWDHYGYSTHELKSYQGGYTIYNLSGGTSFQQGSIGGIPQPVGPKTPRQFIPVAQGFFVSGMSNNEKIQFKNSQRAYQKENLTYSQFIRTSAINNSKNQSSKIDVTPRVYLKYYSPTGFQRQLLVAFIPNTTDGIDIGYDAVNNEGYADDMSWVAENIKMIIQAVPTMYYRVLPLEIKASTKGMTKISIDFLENITDETNIFLKDNVNGTLYNLRTADYEINLSPGTYSKRFELVLQPQKTLLIEEEFQKGNLVNIYLNNPEAKIYINKLQTVELKEISIYNLIGQQIFNLKKGLQLQNIEIPFNVPIGVYIIKISTNNDLITKKILKE